MTIDLESRLAGLGEHLAVDDDADGLVDDVLARLDEPDLVGDSSDDARSRGWLRAAVILIVVVGAALLAVPASREAIADWFGLDGVEIDQQPGLSVPTEPPAVGDAPSGGLGTVVEVDGVEVLVGSIDGVLDDPLINKSLAAGTGIEQVEVAEAPGLWIDGDPHVVTYRAPDGSFVTQRFAGNTLLWQDGDTIRRLEGFPTLAAALNYAQP